jgi:DNA repair protein RadD
MSVVLRDLVSRVALPELRKLLGPDVLELASIFDNKLVESNAIRQLAIGVDGGRSLVATKTGWKTLIGVLPQESARELSVMLGLGDLEVYDRLDEFQIHNANENDLEKVIKFFGIPPKEDFREFEKVASSVVKPDYKLFEHQRNPAMKVMRVLKSGQPACVLHLPTGGGKTRTSMVVICRWLVENPGSCVVWLAASEELLSQAADEFEEAWKNLGDRDVSIERVWGNSQLVDRDFSDTFLVGGLQKLVSIMDRDAESMTSVLQNVSLIVFDEAHQAIAPTYSDLIGFLRSRNKELPLLGLTATPGRTIDNAEEDEKLAEFFGNTKIQIEVDGFDTPVDYLVSNGYLAKANFIDVKFESKQYERSSATTGDISDDVLGGIGADNRRNAELIKAAIALSERHSRILLFAPTVKSAKIIAMVLAAKGLDAYSLDNTTDGFARRAMINKFKGNLEGSQVLCNFGVLTTGFDAPRTSCVIIGRPTKSVVLYSQMIGRALRGISVGGNKEADVVTVVDTSLRGFGSVSESFNFWDKKWW